jgi:hypothetical protein
MIRSAKLNLLVMAAGCLLLPIVAAGESRVGTEAQRSAHVLFKIVIPQVLSIEIADGESAYLGQALAISSNEGNVRRISTTATDAEHPHVILSTAGHRSTVQFATCVATDRAQPASGMSCTVSMP